MGLVNVPDLGEAVLLPFQPEAPMTETLEWKTDLLNSHDGTETRQRIRNAARQSFSMECPVPFRNASRAVNITYGGRARARWLIPVWTEAQPVGSVSFGATSLSLETAHRDFRDGSLALVWESPEKWRVVRIVEVLPGELTLSAEVGQTLHGAWVTPLRVGCLRGNLQRKTNGHRTSVVINQVAEDNRALEPSAPPQFEGHDIYFDGDLFSGSGVTEDITARVDVIDYEAGLTTQFAPWVYNRRSRPFRRVLDGPEEVWAFREFLHRRAGRFRPFWLPSFEHDLFVDMAGPVTDTLLFRANAYAELGSDQTHIAVQTRDGAWAARTITEVTPSGNFLAATLDAPLVGVDARDISRVSFLGLKRLDTDRVELRYQGGGVCVCEVRIIEVSP